MLHLSVKCFEKWKEAKEGEYKKKEAGE